MLPDYHIHTALCKHAEGTIAEYLEAARQKKLPEICLTDHAPNPDHYDQKHRMTLDQFDSYREMVRAAQGGSPPVLFGLEADFYEGGEKFLRAWLPRREFDLVLGSIHYIRNWGFDNPAEREVWDSVDVAATWREYFALLGRLADTRLFDVIGHFDLPKKFGYFPPEKQMKTMLQSALDKIARAGMAIEINTSGLRKPIKEIYPGRLALELARERQIPVCFGSDAHQPGEVGHEFAAALAWARKAGYTRAVRFAGRKKIPYDLPLIHGAGNSK